ncbi:GIY-YIG nuclease family protein [Salmonella enterica subsp. enterica serovar Derby]|nr:GIY-YIG nuclease family protein [Salmonella enterica subsp. enterica serovar Derby]
MPDIYNKGKDKIYVGSSKRKMLTRILEHYSDIAKKRKTNTSAIHEKWRSIYYVRYETY